MKPKLLISACLCGKNTKYNGGNNLIEQLKELEEQFELVLICPEVMGGLATPRVPSEIVGEKVLSKDVKVKQWSREVSLQLRAFAALEEDLGTSPIHWVTTA